MELSEKVANIAPSLTLAITAKAKQMKKDGISVVSFGAGEPDFNTPDYIVESAKKALDTGFTKYTPASGMPELREAVAEKFEKDNGLRYTPEQIVVSCGAKSSLFHAIAALVDAGDEVLIPAPYWLTYPELVKLAGGVCVFVPAEKERGYKVKAEDLKNRTTDKTKLLILNSPNNPTGAVYTKEELSAIAAYAEEAGIYVISDEIYEKLVYGGETHVSIAGLSAYMKEHTVVVNGVSKSYAMTGWRIGYLAAPTAIAKAIGAMQSHTTSNPNSIAQYASVAALSGGADFIEQMRAIFDERRRLMAAALKEIDGVRCYEPKGAFYAFCDVSSLYGKSYEGESVVGSLSFADCALREGVALIPGIAFGDDRCIRLSYAISKEDIAEGLRRLALFVKKLK